MIDAFLGKIYPIESNPATLVYNDAFGSWDLDALALVGLTALANVHGDFEFTSKPAKTHIDDDGNTVVDSETVTGKVTVSLDPAAVSTIIGNYAGLPKSYIVHNADQSVGEYFHDVVMNFVQTGKIGELVTGELTFEYTASTNTPGATARRRRFSSV
jgi:hypothetical protein